MRILLIRGIELSTYLQTNKYFISKKPINQKYNYAISCFIASIVTTVIINPLDFIRT